MTDTADTPTRVERVTWTTHLERMEWAQGEHCTFIGTTGSGKTEAALAIIQRWSPYTLVVTTKRNDQTLLNGLRGYRTIRSAKDLMAEFPRTVFRARWPRGRDWKSDILPEQREEIRRLILAAWRQGGWTVLLDELPYLTAGDMLALSPELKLLWLQGRSEGVAAFANTQRPRHVPLEAYSQATHLHLWNTKDAQDIARQGDLSGGFDRDLILRELRTLTKHDILYLNTDRGVCHVTNTRW